jgi:hypothetical protein
MYVNSNKLRTVKFVARDAQTSSYSLSTSNVIDFPFFSITIFKVKSIKEQEGKLYPGVQLDNDMVLAGTGRLHKPNIQTQNCYIIKSFHGQFGAALITIIYFPQDAVSLWLSLNHDINFCNCKT